MAMPEASELLVRAAVPTAAAKLTAAQISAALKRAGHRGDLAATDAEIRAALSRKGSVRGTCRSAGLLDGVPGVGAGAAEVR